jgi:hypothetical protein
MSSLDIAPRPEGAPIRARDQCRTRRRPRISFRRAGICTFWRLDFKQFSFHHIARVPRHTVPDTWTRSPVFWHALVPLTFQRRVSHQTQGHPSNPSRLRREYNEAPRGAPLSCRCQGVWRFFTDSVARDRYDADGARRFAREAVADLRATTARYPDASGVHRLVDRLLATSGEFRDLWAEQDVEVRRSTHKRLHHPVVGWLDLDCDALHDPHRGQWIVLYTAAPGTPPHEALHLLKVVGSHNLDPS